MNKDALALAAKINKDIGDDLIVVASDMRPARTFPSGSLSLDLALGGGWPGNHWVEIYGKESHGKTAVTLKTIAANQERDPNFTTLWIAGEHYDTAQAAALGVNNEQMLVVPTQTMEHAFDTMLAYAESRAVDAIVLDSYPALVPSEEEAKDMDESVMALGARLFGKFFRKVGPAMRRGATERPLLGIIVNQQRDKIGGWAPNGMIPQTTPGGNAKNYAYYTRVQVKRDDWIVDSVPGKGKINVGQTIKIETVKNKATAPKQVATVDFYFRDAPTKGFLRGEYDTVKENILLGIVHDVIERRGAYYHFGGQSWQGKDPMFTGIAEDVELRAELEAQVREKALSKPREVTEEDLQAAAAEPRKVRRRDPAA